MEVYAEVHNFQIYVVNIYAPCSMEEKCRGWVELVGVKQRFEVGEWCVVGDFNVVSSVEERKGRNGGVSTQDISGFNEFIIDMDLFDV